MFPHTVTLFNIFKKKDKVYYHKTVLNGVFFYKSNQVTDEGNGIVNASQYHCVVPSELLDNYVERKDFNKTVDKENKYTFASKDIIVYGECEDINSVNELQISAHDYFTIKTINDNRYGSEDLQSIEVTS